MAPKSFQNFFDLRVNSVQLIFGSLTFSLFYFFLNRFNFNLNLSQYYLVTIYTAILLYFIAKLSIEKKFEKYFILLLFFHTFLFYLSKFTNNKFISIILLGIVLLIFLYRKTTESTEIKYYSYVENLISFLLGIIGSSYVVYTQIFRKLVTPLHEINILEGTFHHDSLYRAAIANMFYVTGVPTTGINNLNRINNHYFSEIYLSIFSNTINPGESTIFNLYFFKIVFVPSVIFLLISKNRKVGNLILFFLILASLTLVHSYWGTKSFNNLPFVVSVIFFILGFDYLNQINKKRSISFGNLVLLSIILNLTFISKVTTGLALALILIINLDYKKIDYRSLIIVVGLLSYPTINILFITSMYTSSLKILDVNYKVQTSIVLFLLVLLNLYHLKKIHKLTLILLFTSSIIFSYFINSWNQSFFLEFMVFIFIVITSQEYVKSKYSIIFLVILTFSLTFLREGNLTTIKSNLFNAFPENSNEVNYELEFGRLIKAYSDYKYYDIVFINSNSFVWDSGYSCQYRYLITPALISKQTITNPPDEFIDCKGYSINDKTISSE